MSTTARLNLRYLRRQQEPSHSPHTPHTPSEGHRPSSSLLHGAARKRRPSGVRGCGTEDRGSPILAPPVFHALPNATPPIVPDFTSPLVPQATPPSLSDATPSSVLGDQLVPCEDWQVSTDEEDLGLYTTSCKKR